MKTRAILFRLGLGAAAVALLIASKATLADNAKDVEEGLQKLHAANQLEINAGRVALQKGTSPQVKSFAQRMIDDHTKNDAELAQIAENKGIAITGKDFDRQVKSGQGELDRLQKGSGERFDRAYMDDMKRDHEKDLKALRKLTEKAEDPGVKSFLQQTDATVADHLEHAKSTLTALESRTANRHQLTSPGTAPTGAGVGE